LWIEQQEIARPKCHSPSNLWECKVTYDPIIHLLIMVVNVGLNNRHSKILIDMRSQVDINSKTQSM
jgi:hypothetical protein